MFQNLSQKLLGIFDHMRGQGALTEEDITSALREIRIALLEADVALPALKEFIESVKKEALGERVLKSLTPAHVMTKIVHDHLIELLSHPNEKLYLNSHGTTCFLMVGLQGSGKTTMCGKLAYLLKERNKKILMASLDIYRPAAQHQLELIAQSLGVDSLSIVPDEKPLSIAQRALAVMHSYDVLILDTAGRLHIDQDMMDELKQIKTLCHPHETLFVADALSGQDCVHTAKVFQEAVEITGICLSRIDGDSRGGAALSLRVCTQRPIKLLGTGERPSQVMLLDPEKIADRILDKGDILGLVTKATEAISKEEQDKTLRRLEKGIFTLEDFADKIKSVEKMGGVSQLLEMIPGMQSIRAQVQDKLSQNPFKKQLAIISSMTRKERSQPDILNASRKRRIAQGSGTSVQEINRLLQQFQQMQKMMKQMRGFKFWKKS